uniref:Uncharacterized protein n=1 Tax=Physcomitrium patens TaxID=3218 RepID=A0A2K1KQN2_PHYPA|nr:hypothetical protein PHYPA_006963 [Physcomitrium patens]
MSLVWSLQCWRVRHDGSEQILGLRSMFWVFEVIEGDELDDIAMFVDSGLYSIRL